MQMKSDESFAINFLKLRVLADFDWRQKCWRQIFKGAIPRSSPALYKLISVINCNAIEFSNSFGVYTSSYPFIVLLSKNVLGNDLLLQKMLLKFNWIQVTPNFITSFIVISWTFLSYLFLFLSFCYFAGKTNNKTFWGEQWHGHVLPIYLYFCFLYNLQILSGFYLQTQYYLLTLFALRFEINE